MATFAGSSLVVSWKQAAATTTLTGDHKSLTYTPSIKFINSAAGADAQETYIANRKDGAATFNAVFQSGTGSGGTSTFSTVVEGAAGTLEWIPEGTTGGTSSMPAFSQGAQYSYPFDNVVEVTVNFQQNGARVDN